MNINNNRIFIVIIIMMMIELEDNAIIELESRCNQLSMSRWGQFLFLKESENDEKRSIDLKFHSRVRTRRPWMAARGGGGESGIL